MTRPPTDRPMTRAVTSLDALIEDYKAEATERRNAYIAGGDFGEWRESLGLVEGLQIARRVLREELRQEQSPPAHPTTEGLQ